MDILCKKFRRGEISETNFRLRATELTLLKLERINVKYAGGIGYGYHKVNIELCGSESQLNVEVKIHLGDYEIKVATWDKIVNDHVLPILTYRNIMTSQLHPDREVVCISQKEYSENVDNVPSQNKQNEIVDDGEYEDMDAKCVTNFKELKQTKNILEDFKVVEILLDDYTHIYIVHSKAAANNKESADVEGYENMNAKCVTKFKELKEFKNRCTSDVLEILSPENCSQADSMCNLKANTNEKSFDTDGHEKINAKCVAGVKNVKEYKEMHEDILRETTANCNEVHISVNGCQNMNAKSESIANDREDIKTGSDTKVKDITAYQNIHGLVDYIMMKRSESMKNKENFSDTNQNKIEISKTNTKKSIRKNLMIRYDHDYSKKSNSSYHINENASHVKESKKLNVDFSNLMCKFTEENIKDRNPEKISFENKSTSSKKDKSSGLHQSKKQKINSWFKKKGDKLSRLFLSCAPVHKK